MKRKLKKTATVAMAKRTRKRRTAAATTPVQREATRPRKSQRNSYLQDKNVFNTVCAF